MPAVKTDEFWRPVVRLTAKTKESMRLANGIDKADQEVSQGPVA